MHLRRIKDLLPLFEIEAKFLSSRMELRGTTTEQDTWGSEGYVVMMLTVER